MKSAVHHYPSVGSLIKKVIEINPDLGVQEIRALIQQGTRTQNTAESEFISADYVDEKKVLQLARETILET